MVIYEKSKEIQSKDVAAIVAAGSKQNGVLSHVWMKQRTNHLRVSPPHIFISGIATGIAMGIIAYIVGVPADYSFSIMLACIVVSSIALLITIYRNADTLEYEVAYKSTEKETAVDSKITYRIETKKGSRLTMMDLPAFFQSQNVAALANMHQQGERFNVRNITRYGVCTQQQFPELRDKLAHSNMLIKDGKSWELADEFLTFAEQAKQSI